MLIARIPYPKSKRWKASNWQGKCTRDAEWQSCTHAKVDSITKQTGEHWLTSTKYSIQSLPAAKSWLNGCEKPGRKPSNRFIWNQWHSFLDARFHYREAKEESRELYRVEQLISLEAGREKKRSLAGLITKTNMDAFELNFTWHYVRACEQSACIKRAN